MSSAKKNTVVYEARIEHVQILDEQGNLDAEQAKGTLTDAEVVELYEWMTICRHYDEIAFKLQRSGRMGTYPQNKGQEAGPAGAGLAIRKSSPDNWLVPCYRENIALFLNGLPMEKILLHWMGDERGNQIPDGVNILPISIPIGTHPLHAAGIAWALKYRRKDAVAVAFFGDGATSEGDVHEACNFAGALGLPCVFFCQNNFWAISVPRKRQTASETFAQKGLAYGHKCVQIDGNDIFASYKVMRDAIEFVKTQGRPVFIEAVTYRLGDHTTADDARRYRDEDELASWVSKDPLIRTRKHLEKKGLWDDAKQAALAARAKQHVDGVVKRAEGIEPPTVDDIFDYTFATLPEELEVQKRTLRTSGLGQAPEQERLRSTP
ncbi:MAG TPA: pyruvate dehydrogenase (acetyl-transferring) E1 component subunit alpha [Phycisphaerales bacterium]|nr:pyruvate dehydrogenase (acetyl-transferring) E1 component subunit alpha [Phycisphaerales bacterium]